MVQNKVVEPVAPGFSSWYPYLVRKIILLKRRVTMTRFNRILAAAVIAVAAVTGFAVPAVAAPTSSPSDTILDGADVFTDAQEADLYKAAEADFNEYGVVYVVETIPTLNGESLESYSLNRANELGVGSTLTNNGIYVLLSMQERAIRFELGSGVAGKVSDATADVAINDYAVPQFKQENYLNGLTDSMDYLGSQYNADPAPGNTEAFDTDEGIAGGTILLFLAALVGGLVVVALLVTIIWFTIKAVKQKKTAQRQKVFYEAEQKAKREIAEERRLKQLQRDEENRIQRALQSQRNDFVNKIAGAAYSEKNPKYAGFGALPNQAAREAVIMDEVTDYVATDPEFNVAAALTLINQAYFSALLRKNEQKGLRNANKLAPRYDFSMSVNKSADFVVDRFKKAVDKRIIAQAKQDELDRIADLARKAAEERRKEEQDAENARLYARRKAAEDEAKKVWDSLTVSEKRTVKQSRTKAEKKKALTRYASAHGYSGVDMGTMFPILLTMYAYDIGQPQETAAATYSGYSSPSSGGSSRSYSSPSYSDSGSSYSGSSFGGGSFDGGGSSGGW
jgi:uncharacterized protein